jgi:hypothetical protein
MPQTSPGSPTADPGSFPSPARLWNAVLSARDALAHERHQYRRPSEPTARVALLEALEAYVRSLDERGHPVPYALRDDLRLQRLACVTTGPLRSLSTRAAQPDRGRRPR